MNAQPHDLRSERAALGSMIISGEAVEIAQQKISLHDFYSYNHKLIFQAIVDVYDGSGAIDPVLLRDKLKENKQFAKIGGSAYIRELAETVPTAANAEYYFNIVRDRSIRRHTIKILTKTIKDAYDEGQKAEEILDNAESKVLEIRNAVVEDNIQHSDYYLYEAVERINAAVDNPEIIQGIAYGFDDLDKLTAGMHPGEMIVLAARPSIGKTTLAINFIYNACVIEKRSVGICSLEMTGQQLLTNMICLAANKKRLGQLNGMQLRTGRGLIQDDVTNIAEKIKGVPFYIDDTAGLKITDLRAKARRMKKKHKIELFIVDYMQQLQPAQRCENRAVAVSEVSNGVKEIAKELNIPVIAIAQLNRASVHETPRVPRMSDLRESGAIEQDADVIILLHQVTDAKDFKEGPVARHVLLIVEKQRNGLGCPQTIYHLL